MRTTLTERQNEVFECIRTYMRERGKPPTIQELARELGIRSTNGVTRHLHALEKKGYIVREPHTARGLQLVDAQDPFALDDGAPALPVVSRTSSSKPNLLRHRPAAYFNVDPYFLQKASGPDGCIIGRSADDGMVGEGIRKGDFLLIEERSAQQMRNGDIAACLVGEELRVRRIFQVRGKIHLRVANRRYTEEEFGRPDPGCYVVGRVIGLLRRM